MHIIMQLPVMSDSDNTYPQSHKVTVSNGTAPGSVSLALTDPSRTVEVDGKELLKALKILFEE